MTAEERAAFHLALFGRDDENGTYAESDGSTDRVPTGGCLGQARAAIDGVVAEGAVGSGVAVGVGGDRSVGWVVS